MLKSVGLSLVFLAAAAGCSAPVGSDAKDDARSTKQAIVGGQLDTSADDAVVFLSLPGGSFCTGSLITPNLVLTARHCLNNLDETVECGNFTTPFAANQIGVATGVNGNNGQPVAHGKQIFVESQLSSCGFDIGLLLLDQDVPGAKVAAVRTGALQNGETARAVGFGDDGSGTPTNGRFVRGGLTVEGVGPATFVWQTDQGQQINVPVANGEVVTGESTCFGDSGGPLFDAKGAIIGITSRGVDQSCIDRPSIFSGLTTHVQLINSAVAASGHTLGSSASTPSTTNPGTGTSSNVGNGNKSTSTGDEGDPADDSTSTSGSKRANLDSGGVSSSGCSASGAGRHPTDSVLAGLILGAALVILGRRRAVRTAG